MFLNSALYKSIYKYWHLISALLLLTGIGWVVISAVPIESSDNQIYSPHKGFKAPNFTLETVDASSYSLSDLRGQVILINFWASWCPPCQAEMPDLLKVYEDYNQEGFIILAINSTIQDTLEDARSFVQVNQLSFPILIDPTGEVTEAYQIRALPTSLFIDRNGVVQEIFIGGPLPEALLRKHIELLLNSE